MSGPVYRFTSRWTVPAPPGQVFDRLADLVGYPAWWPQVRAAARADDDTVLLVCRSLLPYSLELELTRQREDRADGVLEARLAGHLAGWSRWTLADLRGSGSGPGTALLYEQEVTTRGRLLSAGTRVARPVLVGNHAWMMRGGRRGLLRTVAGRDGRTPR